MDFTYANTKTHNNHEFAFISREFLSPVLRTETKTTHGKQIDINKNNMPAQEFSHNYLYYFMYYFNSWPCTNEFWSYVA